MVMASLFACLVVGIGLFLYSRMNGSTSPSRPDAPPKRIEPFPMTIQVLSGSGATVPVPCVSDFTTVMNDQLDPMEFDLLGVFFLSTLPRYTHEPITFYDASRRIVLSDRGKEDIARYFQRDVLSANMTVDELLPRIGKLFQNFKERHPAEFAHFQKKCQK